MTHSGLLWVSLPYATFGAVVKDSVIVEVAPIARWCLGRPASALASWARKKGARMKWMKRR